jgi:serine phosphatase RsbU (regulator of sigma subunit)
VLIVTDGVTESQLPDGDFYGEDPLTAAAMATASLDDICRDLQTACGSLAADDDCTLLDVRYMG